MVQETAYPPSEDEVVTKVEMENDSLYEERHTTWKEFKAQVEAAGVTDDMEVSYIDWDDSHDLQVQIYKGEHVFKGSGRVSFNVT